MNYIKHLSVFFEYSDSDARLTPFHISLYLALFRCWNLNFFSNPVSISRNEMMKMAKIGSVNTYVRCLKELHAWKYVRYEPSFNRHKGSLVYLYTFDNSADNAHEMPLRPSLNKRNYLNKTNLEEQAKKNEINFLDMDTQMKEKKGVAECNVFPPSFDHVKIYFNEKGVTETEAEKFFNYFESNGWLVGGRAKMKDWKAAARNWILNIPKFNHRPKPSDRPIHLNQTKNYDEPL